MERLGGGWSNLPQELQREMEDVRELLEQAADQGHALAMHNLGHMYYEGQGVAQDFTKAREWYELAAAQGHAMAQSNVGDVRCPVLNIRETNRGSKGVKLVNLDKKDALIGISEVMELDEEKNVETDDIMEDDETTESVEVAGAESSLED